MRKSRYWWVMIGAAASGLLAGYVALVYVSAEPAPLEASVPSRTALVANRDLPAGAIIRKEDVKSVTWPGSAVPRGLVTGVGDVVGRGLITEVRENEPLLEWKLAHRDGGGGLPITIPEGMRAVSVRVDEVVGVAGFVLPGTHVDVLATVVPGNDRRQTTTRIILQNVRALAADQQHQKDIEGEPKYVTVVTLLLTPEDAEVLTLAATEGRIQLALRNTLDAGEIDTPGRRITSLVTPTATGARRSSQASSSSAVQAPPAPMIESYEGGRRTLLRFERGGGR